MNLRRWLASSIARAAALRLRRRRPDWADAMLNEQANLTESNDQLAWALGSLKASLQLDDAYPAALVLAVGAMALYQWSADESLITLSIMASLCLILGCLRPAWFVLSGISIGVVVTVVNAFETLTDIAPAYETHHHTWAHDLRWLLLVLPAVLSSALGRRMGSLHSD